MENINSNTHFTLMAFGFVFRDLFIPREVVLKEAGNKTFTFIKVSEPNSF